MCGRSRCTLAPERVVRAAAVHNANIEQIHWIDQDQFNGGYNLTPGASTPVIRRDKDSNNMKIHTMKWGLVPSFTKPTETADFWRMFNCRSETMAEKPSFRRLIPTKRCLVLLDGFYEWKAEGKQGKQPYYIYLEGEPMVCAGLFDSWHKSDGETMYTYTILTTDSSKKLEWLHDRMPCILRDKESQEMWLSTNEPSSVHKLDKILVGYSGDDLKWYPVTKAMSNPSFQGPECSQPLKKPPVQAFFQPRSTTKKTTTPTKEEMQPEKNSNAAAPVVNTDECPEKQQEGEANYKAPGEFATTPVKISDDKDGNNKETNGKKRHIDDDVASPGDAGPSSSSQKKKKAKLPGQQDITKFFGGK